MNDSNPIHLFGFPLHLKHPNAYWDRLVQALGEAHPFVFHQGTWLSLLGSWHKNQVVHIHWPQILYANRLVFLQPIKFWFSTLIVRLAKLRGDRVVWTFHNIADHDEVGSRWDRKARIFLAQKSDSVIVHTEAGAAVMRDQYQRSTGVIIIPHGHAVDFYGPRQIVPDQALMKRFNYQLSDTIFLHLGSLRPYKGLETLIDVFNQLPDNFKLLIAGKSFSPSYVDELQQRINSQSITIEARRVPDGDMPAYYSLADAAIFSFTEILTSGSVIVALSYGVPAIVPDQGDMPWIIESGHNGYLYHSKEELNEIITRYAHSDQDSRNQMRSEAQTSMEKNSYQTIAQLTLQAYGIK